MQTLARIVHLLSLGLWSGGVTFFSFFTALPVIRRLEELALSKPDWLPGLAEKQQGTRLAGIALSAVFDRYFYFQIVCGVLALATAILWVGLQGSVHKLRVVLLAAALLLVLTNTFVFNPRVSQLGHRRREEGKRRLRHVAHLQPSDGHGGPGAGVGRAGPGRGLTKARGVVVQTPRTP